ncbi:hypothetical protein A6V25_32050 [Nostoc sp. ATCC 53789]|nr:DDE-type integrase/transposase/recombinase [Nostoc sp. ATCC 53789]RCJ15805.1 hypothetical protein A6V25_32050 [Nostoc sp. ATCC 53789]
MLKCGLELDFGFVLIYLKQTNDSWRVDETYIQVKGEWKYLYRPGNSVAQAKFIKEIFGVVA